MPNLVAKRSPLARRASGLFIALFTIAFLTGGHCGNDVTAPLVTTTPVPAPTPAPASLVGGFDRAGTINFTLPIVGANVTVTQNGRTKTATTNHNGAFEIDGLLSGAAQIAVTASSCNYHRVETIVLVAGKNYFDENLPCP